MIIKRALASFAKVAVSLLLLGMVIYTTDLASVWRSMSRVHLPLILVASALFFVGYFVTSLRWRLLLSIGGVKVPIRYLMRSFLVASFFNNLLPSSMGGDVVRVYDSWRLGLGKGAALGTILVDRAFGMVALGAYASTGLALSPTLDLGAMASGVILAAAAGVTLSVLAIFSSRRLLDRATAWISHGALRRVLDPALAMFRPYSGQTRSLVKCFVLSMLLQGNVLLFFWLTATALGLDIGLLDLALVVPVALVLLMLPITINGIGLREGIFVVLLGYYGITSADAVAFSFLIYLQTLAQGLLGGVVFALRSEKRLPASTSATH